jgi:RelA/SpoT family (p)ppGpp synthetase
MPEAAENHSQECLQNQLVKRLSANLADYLDESQVHECIRAYEFGANAHLGQARVSGEPYICHPLSVAILLAEMRMDASGIMAAILHDVIEDCRVSKKTLASLFGEEVANLVDGVTKLTKINDISRAEAQAENVHKMFLAMGKDLRVILVKLADRLHNMQTLESMPPEKKRRIARETLDIYAPIANRLGMNTIRHKLELLSFEAMYPMRCRVLRNEVKKVSTDRYKFIDSIQTSIKNRLEKLGLQCEVTGREKNVYSIYKKMVFKKLSLAAVFDVYAFRIFCDSLDSCYRVLGQIHNLYKPIPGRFKDYIALPKANGYQSLHTLLIGPHGLPIEIQIRTQEMHRMAESGIAAHWLYKSENDKSDKFKIRAYEWLNDLLEIQKSVGDSLEFIDNLKVDLFSQEVFVFTPKGDIVKIPRGATVVDFAYTVHTDIGNACISGRIDNKLVPLQTKLENGVTVEVITAPWARPNPLWLNYVTTVKARSGIRNYLKHFKQKEAISLGRRILEKELQTMQQQLENLDKSRITAVLKDLSMKSLDELYENIGLGNNMPFLVAKRLTQDDVNANVKLDYINEKAKKTPLIIKGTEGMVITLAKCCRPIPGDAIIGFFNPGKGIVVHHHGCRNRSIVNKKHTSWLDIDWSPDVVGDFSTEIRVEILNQRGALATITAAISEQNSNIENVKIVDQDTRVCTDFITMTVKSRKHLAQIIRKLKDLSIVLKITRVKA